MKIVAITAEYNPLHLGHIRLMERAKALSPDILLVIQSGDITQRGSLAILDKYTRAKHALCAGADAVIDFRLATSSVMDNAAEIIAYGTAVRLRKAVTEDRKA